MVLVGLFIFHWYFSVFVQSFFLHRYAAHGMMTISPRREKFFYILTWLAQGPSYLSARAYGILHNAHHAYSDTDKDPHSPHFSNTVLGMMWKTALDYDEAYRTSALRGEKLKYHVRDWPEFERLVHGWPARFLMGALYVIPFYLFADRLWQWIFLPLTWIIGPVHGAIVNWCGHKYGYQNHKIEDKSRNTLPIDFLMVGELYQNNHHNNGSKPNFADAWFEIDLGYWIVRLLDWFGLIEFKQKKSNSRQSQRSRLVTLSNK